MSITEVQAKARELKELKIMAADLEAEINALEDSIKDHMKSMDAEEIIAGAFKITWKAVTSARVDTTALKKTLPDIAERFMKTTTTRRFCVQ